MDHDRNRRRFGKSDDELVEYFANAIGVKAQNMDNAGGAFDSNEAHYGRLAAMQRGHLRRFDRTEATLARLSKEHRDVLVLVYTPHGAPTWLADALSPAWGGGSYVQLSIRQPRAKLAAKERPPGRTILDWLVVRGRTPKDPLLTSLREDSEDLRIAALEAYEVLRRERVKAEQQADRNAKQARDERNTALYHELTGRIRAKRTARFEAKLRRAS